MSYEIFAYPQGHKDFLLRFFQKFNSFHFCIYVVDPFQINFAVWLRGEVHVIFHTDIQFFQVICWKYYSYSHWAVVTALEKKICYINLSPLLFCLFPCTYLFSLLQMPHFCDHCSFTVSLEIRLCKFSNFVLLFQNCFGYYKSFALHMNFIISLSNFSQKSPLVFHWLYITQIWENSHLHNIKSSETWT